MTMADPPAQPLPWREALPLILSAAQSSSSSSSSLCDLCHDFLPKDGAGGGSGGNSGSSEDVVDETSKIPDTVLRTVQTIYVRSLLLSDRYDDAVRYCKAQRVRTSNQGANQPSSRAFHLRLEECYALYRLKSYAAARDLCRSTLTRGGFDPEDLASSSSSKQTTEEEGGNDDDIPPPLGLLHTLAQSLYRLNETVQAAKVYSHIVKALGSGEMGDVDELDEVMANGLAVEVANCTYVGAGSGDKQPLPRDDEIEALLEKGGDSGEYNYDLGRNYALRTLLSATSTSSVRKSLALLTKSQEECQSILEDDGATESEISDEVSSIACDRAFALQILGDRQEASRAYFDLVSAGNGGNGGVKTIAKHNLAVLSSQTNAAGALKQMPDVASLVLSTKGRTTPHQVRTMLYNRALLLLRLNKHADCRTVLAELKAALDGGSAGGKKKKKKKKQTDGGGPVEAEELVGTPATPAESTVWSTRIAIVECELLRGEGKTDEAIETIGGKATELTEALSGSSEADKAALEYGLAELGLYRYEVTKNKRSAGDEESKEKDGDAGTTDAIKEAIEVLNSIPGSIKSRPAVLGALASLYGTAGMDEEVAAVLATLASSSSDGQKSGGSEGSDVESAKARAAQLYKVGKYDDVVEVLQPLLADDALPDEVRWDVTARLVQALSHVDPAQAQEVAATLPGGEASPDGSELEARETPRLGKDKAGGGRLRKLASAGGVEMDSQKRTEKSEAVLRRKAKKRELYLQKLEKEGRYNPDRPSKPDPERWIPKNQRSYAKRGRRGRNKFVGAQGGGIGAGADRDAARLDAAARAAAKQEGGEGGESGGAAPSTAHMEVSGSGPVRRKGGRR